VTPESGRSRILTDRPDWNALTRLSGGMSRYLRRYQRGHRPRKANAQVVLQATDSEKPEPKKTQSLSVPIAIT